MTPETKHNTVCMSLQTYYRSNYNGLPYNKEKFVMVRTNLDGRELIGWVERKRLAHLAKALSHAAYMGYDTVYDPEVPHESYPIPYNKRVYQAIMEVIKERHKEQGKRPGEKISAKNPVSFDKLALILSLSGR